ncbi:GNAT family N-acetyltransferase [Brevibacillus ginsengisoli]|uniref:GNAT family N-acetyltransferase n=1 Tax=Brevibacillus ginsengisoli TaxID=363854 RepID=UPI003CF160F7
MIAYQLATIQQLPEVSQFIAFMNQHREHNNPWLPSDMESIKKVLAGLPFEEVFVLALSAETSAEDQLIGALGYYPFPEQGLIRILGPYVRASDWQRVVSELWDQLLLLIPHSYEKIRISLDEKNQNGLAFFGGLGFVVYNAEASLSLELNSGTPLPSVPSNPSVTIRPYTTGDLESFNSLHPLDAYFSASDIVNRISDTHLLFLIYEQNRMVGYTYVEIMEALSAAEICFIRVLEAERNKRYGSQLLAHVITWLRDKRNVSHIELSVRVENTAARRLYERFGFHEEKVCVSLEKQLEK